jgi:hypothetical protein
LTTTKLKREECWQPQRSFPHHGSKRAWKQNEIGPHQRPGPKRHIAQEKKMEYTEQQGIAPTYQSNIRAEDGLSQRSQWSTLCEGVLIPLGSLFAVFLFMLGVMLITT